MVDSFELQRERSHLPAMTRTKRVFHELLKLMVQQMASDLYLKVNSKPVLRVEGELYPVKYKPLSREFLNELFEIVVPPRKRAEFQQRPELNIIYSIPEIADRFRVNVAVSRGDYVFVIRRIQSRIPSLEELNLPPILKKLASLKKGLILVTGPTGTGKSTTLAAMIEYINTHKSLHIVTIEDPIEYIFEDKNSIITQREVGIDTNSFADALKTVVRQMPDVIMVGETRDKETALSILQLAETGHLILSTLHSPNTTQAISRMLQFFPQEVHREILAYMALNLVAIISQKLVPRADGLGRVPVCEIMINNARMQELIMEGEFKQIRAELDMFETEGMMSMDTSLIDLYRRKLITLETALMYSESPHNLKLKLKTMGLLE